MVGKLTGRTNIRRGFSATEFDENIFKEILFRMMNGEAVTTITQEPNMPPYSTFAVWANSSPERFAEYARARKIQADYYADDTVAIADTELDSQRARNRMDARRWHASKIAPKKYGDRIQSEINATLEQKFKVDLSSMTSEVREELKRNLLAQMKSTPTIDGDYKVEN